jgi:predicted aspartyl protease
MDLAAQDNNIIPFKLLNKGHILAQAVVNGTMKGNFLIDTGAGIHVFSKKFFDKLSSKQDGYYTAFRHNGEKLDFNLYKISSIRIGCLIQKEPHISFWEKLDEIGIEGIISAKLFEHQSVTFDFPNQQLIIETPKTLDDRGKKGYIVPIQLNQDRGKSLDIFGQFYLNDTVKVELEIDTGSGNFITLHSRYMKDLAIYPSSKNVETKKQADITGTEETIYSTFLSGISLLDAPNIKLTGAEVTFKDNIIYDGLIGNGIWYGRQVTLDIPNRRIIVNIVSQ